MDKVKLKQKFKKIYPKQARLLAIQLDGFSHSVILDSGKGTEIRFDRFSHCMPEGDWSSQAAAFFSDIPNAIYQSNAQEIVFVQPGK